MNLISLLIPLVLNGSTCLFFSLIYTSVMLVCVYIQLFLVKYLNVKLVRFLKCYINDINSSTYLMVSVSNQLAWVHVCPVSLSSAS